MEVKGQHEFKISVQQLWNYLMNPEVLAKITPGVTQLETIAPDQYKSVSDIKIGPVKGSFKGKVAVADKQATSSFTINMEQLSKIGNAHVKVDMLLKEIEAEKSMLSFKGKAKLSGVIARTGQRVLSGVANSITKEVFASLEQHIEEQKTSQKDSSNISPQKAKQQEKAFNKIEPATKNINEVEEPIQATNTTRKTPQPINFFAKVLNFIKQLFGIK